MKKIGKILCVLLCVAMLACTFSVVVAADENAQQESRSSNTGLGAIKRGTYYEMVSPKKLTSTFGYYSDKTGDDEKTFIDCGKGAGLTDGWYGNPGVAGCTKNSGQVAAIITVSETIDLGAIEIVANDRNGEGDGDLIDFDVQAWVDGRWVELVSQENFLFDNTRAVSYTFEAVKTNKVRILINAYWDREAKMKEVALFEKKTGNVTKTLKLSGKIGESDCALTDEPNFLVDGNKTNSIKFTDVVIDVDMSRKGVPVDGFVLYPYSGDKMYPKEVSVFLLTVDGKQFELIGTYKTGWVTNTSVDPVKIVFDKTYVVTAVVVNIDMGVVSEFELFQYERGAATGNETEPPRNPTEPTVAPTEPTAAPTEPTAAPTEPTAAPTEPTAAPTDPTAAPTEPTAAPTDPTAAPTEPTVAPTEPTVAPTEPTAAPTEPEETEPEATEPEVTDPEVTEPEATDPTDPTDSADPTDPTNPTEPSVSSTEPSEAPVDTDDSGKGGNVVVYIVIGLVVVAAAAAAAVIIIKKKIG